MEIFKLDTEDRTEFGTKYAKLLRAARRYPATLVGEGKETVHFSVSADDFDFTTRKNARSFELTISGKTEKAAIQAANFDFLGMYRTFECHCLLHAGMYRTFETDGAILHIPLERWNLADIQN